MRRRTFIAAAGVAVPVHLLAALDDALVILPSPTAAPTTANVTSRLARARALFDSGDLPQLVALLPQVIAAAHANADDGVPDGHVRLAACYDLATEALNKIGRSTASRITADRATAYARMSGSPIAMAAAARSLGIVLRHEGRHRVADRVTLQAAATVEATGLTTPAQAATYAQMLCTCAYNAAQAGDRDRALEMIIEAERAAARLPAHPATGQPFVVTPAHVALYRVGVHWSLGDPGAALHAGRDLHASQFSTPERRGRLHTDLARAWWQCGKPEQAAHALLAAYQHAPGEIRERPSIRAIVTQLAARHPQVAGVRRLVAAVGYVSSH
ncbi:hypothetical protein GCM10022252_44300 [Streptosporangium oxazolinicum]|uniref:Transcriptional regulator n=1 Tax=Streptosporangium oxazolinicum TaxID=909287 RepID=A0ABP8B2T6_9ACTN